MIFRHPEFLYFMLPALVVLFYFLMTQKEHVSTFFSEAVMEKLRVTSNMLTLKARNGLFFFMFVFIIIALAEPVIEQGKIKVKAKSADIMIALDISDSMLASDAFPNRLAHAKVKILSFLEHSDQQRIGVMAFAKESYLVAPLSFDHKAISFLLKQLNTDSITEKGTSFEQLLFSTAQTLNDQTNRYLLIVSDGGDQADFSKEIAQAKEFGIKVFVLAVGTEKGAPIKMASGDFIRQNGSVVISHLNSKIKSLAIESGGAYIEAVHSDEDIKAMLREIDRKTSKKELAEEEVTLYIPLFYYPLGLAMILFALATSSMSRRKEVAVPMALLLSLFVGITPEAKAGLFDFQTLKEAQTAYETGDYNRSSQLYKTYLQENDNAQAQYDYANALYKMGDYKTASEIYENVNSDDTTIQFNSAHNLGNAYAKQGDMDALKKAVAAYEKALAIKDDVQTQENLERVEALLKQKEQEQKQQNQDQENQQNNQSQNSDNNSSKNQDKESDNSQKQQNDKPQNQENSKQKNEKDGESKQDKRDKQHDQNSKPEKQNTPENQEQNKENSNAENQKEKEQNKQNQQQNQRGAEEKKEEEKTAPQQKSAQAKQDESKLPQGGAAQEQEVRIMSKSEEKKWLQRLNEEKIGHLYQLQKMDKNQMEVNDDEKPW